MDVDIKKLLAFVAFCAGILVGLVVGLQLIDIVADVFRLSMGV